MTTRRPDTCPECILLPLCLHHQVPEQQRSDDASCWSFREPREWLFTARTVRISASSPGVVMAAAHTFTQAERGIGFMVDDRRLSENRRDNFIRTAYQWVP